MPLTEAVLQWVHLFLSLLLLQAVKSWLEITIKGFFLKLVLYLLNQINQFFFHHCQNQKNKILLKANKVYIWFQKLYASIRNEPFKIPEDDGNDLTLTFFNPDREGWLLKMGEMIMIVLHRTADWLPGEITTGLKSLFVFLEGGRVKTWKRRWFILTDSCLYYFEYTTVSSCLSAAWRKKTCFRRQNMQMSNILPVVERLSLSLISVSSSRIKIRLGLFLWRTCVSGSCKTRANR